MQQFTSDVNEANAAVQRLAQNREVTVRLNVEGAEQIENLERRLATIKDETVTVEVDVDRNGAGGRQLASLTSGVGSLDKAATGLNDRLKDTRAWLAVMAAPGIVTGIAALVPTLTALGTGAVALAQGFGQAAIGAGTFGAALLAERVALQGYYNLLESTISASREAYLATNEQVEAQLEKQRQDILNTQASRQFNEEINESIIRFTELQAAVGNEVFPVFTEELDAWNEILTDMTPEIATTSRGIAQVAAEFSEFVRTADDGRLMRDFFDFFNESALRGADAVATLGRSFLIAFRPVLPLLSDLQDEVQDYLDLLEDAVSGREFQRGFPRFLEEAGDRFRYLVGIAVDFSQALGNIGRAIGRSGLTDRLFEGLHDSAQGFEELTEEGTRANRSITTFARQSGPLLEDIGDAVVGLVDEFLRVSGALIDFRTEGSKLTVLQQIFRAIDRAWRPLGNLLIETFKALGPIMPSLIENVAELLEVFAGSTGSLAIFLRLVDGILTTFNDLPDPVKSAVANFVALSAVVKLLTGSGVGSLFALSGVLTNIAQTSAIVSGSRGIGGLLGTLGRLALVVGVGSVLVAGLAAVGLGIYEIFKRSPEAREAADDLWDTLKKLGGQANNTFGNLAKNLANRWGPDIADAINDINEAIQDIFDMDAKGKPGSTQARQRLNAERLGLVPPTGKDLTGPWEEAAEKVGEAFANGLAAFLQGPGGGSGKKGGKGELDKAGEEASIDFIGAFVRGFKEADINWGDVLWEFFRPPGTGGNNTPWEQAGEDAREAFFDAFTDDKGLSGAVKNFWNNVKEHFDRGDGGEGKNNTFAKAGDDARKSFVDALTDDKGLSGAIRGFTQRVGRAFTDRRGLSGIVQQVVRDMQRRWQQADRDFGKFVQGLLADIRRSMPRFARDFIRNIERLVRDLRRRWQQADGDFGKFISGILADVRRNLPRFARDFLRHVDGLVKNIAKRWDEADGDFGTFLKNLVTDLAKWALPDDMEKLIGDLLEFLRDSWKESEGDFGDFLGNLLDAVIKWALPDEFEAKYNDVMGATKDWITDMQDALADFLGSIGIGSGSGKARGQDAPRGGRSNESSPRGPQGLPTGGGNYEGGVYHDGVRKMAAGGWVDAEGIYTALTTGMTRAMAEGAVWQPATGGVSDGMRPYVVYGERDPERGTIGKEAYIRYDRPKHEQLPFIRDAADNFNLQLLDLDDYSPPLGMARGGHGDRGPHGSHPAPIPYQSIWFKKIPNARMQNQPMGRSVIPNISLGGLGDLGPSWLGRSIPGLATGGLVQRGWTHPRTGVEFMWYPHVAAVNSEVERMFGVNGTTYPNHGSQPGGAETAVDWLVADAWNTVATGEDYERGQGIVNHVGSKHAAITAYMIWDKMINYYGGGWEPYTGGGGYAPPSDPMGYHQDHVHWSALMPGERGSYSNAGGASGSGPRGGTGFDWGAAISAFLPTLPKPGFGMMGPYGDKLAKAAWNHVTDALEGILSKIADTVGYVTPGGSRGGDPPPATGGLRDWAESGLIYGAVFDATEANINKIMTLAQQESGGDPNARNPSGASGLMQMMPETFAAYQVAPSDDIFNPVHNVGASSRYQLDRYGELVTFSPYTAGGLAMRPQKALVGERGPEFFMPLDKPEAAYRFLNFLEQVHSERSRRQVPGSGGVPGGFDSPEARRAYEAAQGRPGERDFSKVQERALDRMAAELRREREESSRDVADMSAAMVRAMQAMGREVGDKWKAGLGREMADNPEVRRAMDTIDRVRARHDRAKGPNVNRPGRGHR